MKLIQIVLISVFFVGCYDSNHIPNKTIEPQTTETLGLITMKQNEEKGMAQSGSTAGKPNPALKELSILIGEWKTVGKHPMMPGEVLHGYATFEWMEGGAFMIMHSAVEHKDFPAGIAIFGSDDSSEEYSMIYFDEREVSRKYTSTLKDNTWKWWRDDPKFSQRFTGTISADGNSIVSMGEMAKEGGSWQKDLELTYTRIK